MTDLKKHFLNFSLTELGFLPIMRPVFASGDFKIVNRLGVISSYLGFILTLVGLVAGFYSLPSGDSETIGFWLSWVPFGFVLLLAGITTTQLAKK